MPAIEYIMPAAIKLVTIYLYNYSDQWVSLGTFPFNTSGGYVYLGDASGTSMQRIAFDAMKWRLVSTEVAENLSATKHEVYKLEISPNPFRHHLVIKLQIPDSNNQTNPNTQIQNNSAIRNPPSEIELNLSTFYSLLATLCIYDATGRMVKSFSDIQRNAVSSVYSVLWDGCDNSGRQLPAGVYFVMLEHKDTKKIEKVILLK